MTGRDRLRAVLRKEPHDGFAWTTLVDDTSLRHFPEELRGHGGVDFYRHIDCDIFMLNGWNLPHGFRSPELQWGPGVETTWKQEGDHSRSELRAPYGALTSIHGKGGHPLKYKVDSLESLRLFRRMWEGARYVEHDDRPVLEAIDGVIGNDGVVTRFWGPSTVPQLLEMDAGTENFYYLLHDHPDEMDSLIRTIHEKELAAFRILARTPCDSVTLCENTSTYYISPDVYRRYNMPHQREFVDVVKGAGKAAILHMCGHVRDLLADIRETGCDGIHALTPSPTGNTPWEEALDVIGEDLIIFGCLDPSVFISGPLDRIGPTLDRIVIPRLAASNFVLCPFADGVAVPLERFQAVSNWCWRRKV